MNIKQEREFIQQLLEEGLLDSLSVQVLALNRFANSIGYKAVDNDPRKGFLAEDDFYGYRLFESLEGMQSEYNTRFSTEYKIVNRISLQYNKCATKKLSTELHWLEFVKEG